MRQAIINVCVFCLVFVTKHANNVFVKQTQNKGPRELPTECTPSAGGGGADEATGC